MKPKITLTVRYGLKNMSVNLTEEQYDFLQTLAANEYNNRMIDEPEFELANKLCNKFYKLLDAFPASKREADELRHFDEEELRMLGLS